MITEQVKVKGVTLTFCANEVTPRGHTKDTFLKEDGELVHVLRPTPAVVTD